MADTATNELTTPTDEDDFLAAFIAIVRENELRAERDQAPKGPLIDPRVRTAERALGPEALTG
jgi:hypothetical protein